MNEKKQYEAGKHMAMLQFSLKNYFTHSSYTSITIDVCNALIKFAEINNYDRKAIVKTINIDDEALAELLDIVTVEKFEKYNNTDHRGSDYGYYDEWNYNHLVAFCDKGIYSVENYTRIYDDDPAEEALSWFNRNYGLLDAGRILA